MLGICIIFYQVPVKLLFILLPLGVIAFLLCLLISSFLTEPFRSLRAKVDAFLAGSSRVSFDPSGKLYEADYLSNKFGQLTKNIASKQADLSHKEQRENEFISDVAHELRTPLTSIHGNAEMLLDPDLPPELHARFCHTIIDESERLGRLSNDLLTLQRLEEESSPTEMHRVDVNRVAHDAVGMLEPIIRERGANVAIMGDAPDVLGNPDHLKQVVANLVDNATRFIEPGGHVSIELFGLKGNTVIAVNDDGPGFGDIDPKMLFDRFYRGDSSRTRETGGTGLGLPIVKSIVEAHDGSIQAFNEPAGGASFLVAIPSIGPDAAKN